MAYLDADELLLTVLDTLNEAQARWYVAREALARGRGGVARLHEVTGISRPTILKGIRELQQGTPLEPTIRIRRPGGGRKRLENADPRFARALDRLMGENTAGDPMSLLRWTTKSTARIAAELTRQGHSVSDETVRRRLQELGYSLQANVKALKRASPPEQDAQFRVLTAQVQEFLARGEPVLSVNIKKTRRRGVQEPGANVASVADATDGHHIRLHDLGEGAAIPMAPYDAKRDEGFVRVGITGDTAGFIVESLRRWWRVFGRRHYPRTRALLLCVNGGNNRNRAWLYYLQHLADELGLEITVCHHPPGTSKWNQIEHRMSTLISVNWTGKSSVSYETVLSLIGSRTRAELRVKAKLDAPVYEAGLKIPAAKIKRIIVKPHEIYPAR